MKRFKDFKKEVLKDKKISREYEALRPEYEAIQKIIDLRIKGGLTQAQLAKKLQTKQSAVSRLEKQEVNPTIAYLSRLAKIFGKKLVIEFR